VVSAPNPKGTDTGCVLEVAEVLYPAASAILAALVTSAVHLLRQRQLSKDLADSQLALAEMTRRCEAEAHWRSAEERQDRMMAARAAQIPPVDPPPVTSSEAVPPAEQNKSPEEMTPEG
jgi:hypothetical protein